jgi:hypothetical protein
VWNRDIDKSVDIAMIAELAARTATPLGHAKRAMLADFEGKLYAHHNANGNTPWIMPLGIYHRTRRRFGLQYCPICLDEPEPYYRRAWRLSFVTLCTTHRRPLLDRCRSCGRPVNFHRYELGKRSAPLTKVLTSCDVCGHDFRRVRARSAEVEAFDVRTQAVLYAAAETGVIRLPTGSKTRARLYFPVLHQLIKVLCVGRRSRHVRLPLARASSIGFFDPFEDDGHHYADDMGMTQRREAVRMCIWLLDRWPRRFVNFCADNGIWESWILKDFETAPRWFYDEVHRNLYRPQPERLVDYSGLPG